RFSSVSSVPCKTTRYSPVSLLTTSTVATACVELKSISPILLRRVRGDVGDFSRLERSASLKRDMAPSLGTVSMAARSILPGDALQDDSVGRSRDRLFETEVASVRRGFALRRRD